MKKLPTDLYNNNQSEHSDLKNCVWSPLLCFCYDDFETLFPGSLLKVPVPCWYVSRTLKHIFQCYVELDVIHFILVVFHATQLL
jgi:hypothetical protein